MRGTLNIGQAPNRALQMESYPTFHNEVGVPIVRIGCRMRHMRRIQELTASRTDDGELFA
jgi:hypothetical protein